MTQNPLISVVIPVFNREKTISYCLNSVLAQTYENIEVIVVDDCSTDNTVEVVQSHTDPRVRCIVLEKNSGAQAARNRGIREATGGWIAFQDSDDIWIFDKLEKQVVVLREKGFNPWIVVYCDAIKRFHDKNKTEIICRKSIEGTEPYPAILLESPMLFQTMLTSKKALEAIGFLDQDVVAHQEWDASICLAKFCAFIHVNEPLMIYHVGSGDAISSNSHRDIEGYYYILNKHRHDIIKYHGARGWNRRVLELLDRCLNSRLFEEFDFYLNLYNGSAGNPKMMYFSICRATGMKPNNYLYAKIKSFKRWFL